MAALGAVLHSGSIHVFVFMQCSSQLNGTSWTSVSSGPGYWCTIALTCQSSKDNAANQLRCIAGRKHTLAIVPQMPTPLQKLSFECSPEVLLQGHHALSSPRA